MRTYTSGCARNQKRCCQSSGLPPPAILSCSPETTRPEGRKKEVPATRSMICMTVAASSGGKASRSRNAVTSCAWTKNGSRQKLRLFARSCTMVTMKLIEPSSELVMISTIARHHTVCPEGAMSESGGELIPPDRAGPPGREEWERQREEPGGENQESTLRVRGGGRAA